jgi:monoamine oxidase
LLGSQIITGQALVALRRNPDGTYTLTFQSSDQFTDVTADHVVLALPFSILKNSGDLTQAEFSELKMIAIQELAMGSNSKLNVQFDSRPWGSLRCNGETYSDRGYQATWDVTRAQPAAAGILVDYTGGQVADTFETGTPEEHAAEFLAQIEPVLPGLSSHWNGLATVDWWKGILTLAAATATGGSGNTPVLPASNESHKATSISAVNTLQSTLRVIWKARWKRASELRMRSSRLCAKSQSLLFD